MEDAFQKLQDNNRNSVDNIINWLKDAQIVDGSKVTEERARDMFSHVADPSNVQLTELKEVVEKLAEAYNTSADELYLLLGTALMFPGFDMF